MAFNEQELAIIKAGQNAGKSPQEIKDAVVNFRLGIQPPKQVAAQEIKNGGYLSDVATAAGQGVERLKQGFQQAQTGTANPINALESGIKVAEGAAGVVASPLAPLFKPLQDALAAVSDKISNIPGVQEFANTKGGELTSRIAEDVAGLSTIAGTVAGGATGGRVAGALSNAAKKTSSALQGIAETGASGIQQAQTKSLVPAKIMQNVARVSKSKQSKFENMAKESVGEYLVNRGIFGNVDDITTQLFERFQQSRGAADRIFEGLDERFGNLYTPDDVPPLKTAVDALFAREKSIETPGARSRDFARVAELKRAFETKGLTQKEINEVKRLYERNVKVDYLKENKPTEIAKATNIDSAIREWQRKEAAKLGSVNLVEVNRETMLAKQLLDDLGDEYRGSAGNNPVTLTDWIILSELDPAAIASFFAKKAFSNKGVKSGIAKFLAGSPEPTDVIPVFEYTTPKIQSYGDWIKSIESAR